MASLLFFSRHLQKELTCPHKFSMSEAKGQNGLLSSYHNIEIRRLLRREGGEETWDEMVCDWRRLIDGERG
jgi:hypothetical protein